MEAASASVHGGVIVGAKRGNSQGQHPFNGPLIIKGNPVSVKLALQEGGVVVRAEGPRGQVLWLDSDGVNDVREALLVRMQVRRVVVSPPSLPCYGRKHRVPLPSTVYHLTVVPQGHRYELV